MRIGLAGTGRIGALHAATLATLPDAPDVILTDALPGAADSVADQTGATAVANIDELFATGLDGFIIATGTDTHAELLRRAMAERVPTFCEKPVARTVEEAVELAGLERESGVPVHVGFQRRFDSGYRRARDAVQSGELGELHQVRCTTHDEHPPTAAYVATSGGIFRDCSVHDFDALRFVTGREVVEVYATGGSKGERFFADADDNATGAAVLTLDDGTLALVSAMRYNAAGHDVRMELHGTAGALAVGFDDSYAFRSAEPGATDPAGPTHSIFMDRFRLAYVAELTAFCQVVRGEIPSPCTIADALEALRIADACDLSRRQNRPVRLDEIPGLV